MTVAELKKYLQMRGVTVNGYLNLNLKPALLEIAQAVEKMTLHQLFSTFQVIASYFCVYPKRIFLPCLLINKMRAHRSCLL